MDHKAAQPCSLTTVLPSSSTRLKSGPDSTAPAHLSSPVKAPPLPTQQPCAVPSFCKRPHSVLTQLRSRLQPIVQAHPARLSSPVKAPPLPCQQFWADTEKSLRSAACRESDRCFNGLGSKPLAKPVFADAEKSLRSAACREQCRVFHSALSPTKPCAAQPATARAQLSSIATCNDAGDVAVASRPCRQAGQMVRSSRR